MTQTTAQYIRVIELYKWISLQRNTPHLWNDIHLASGFNTSPEVIKSSAKSFGVIPISSCRWKSKPDFWRSSIDSGAYMSSLWASRQDSRSSSKEIISAPDAELEVELPRRDILRKVPFLVCECDPDLNEFQEVDITSHGLVVVVRGGLETTDRPCNNSWELSVLHSRYGSMALDGYSCGRSTPLRYMNIDLSCFELSAFLLRDWVSILLVFETYWDPLRGQGCCSLAAVVVVCRVPATQSVKETYIM